MAAAPMFVAMPSWEPSGWEEVQPCSTEPPEHLEALVLAPPSDPPPCRFFDARAARGAARTGEARDGTPVEAERQDGMPPLSVGSQGHATRTCRPCTFARSTVGCKFGADCQFCHEVADHPEAVRVRPCKGKRERFKRQMAAIEKAISEDPDLYYQGQLSLPALADRSDRSRSRIMAQLSETAAGAYRERIGPAGLAV